MISASRAGWKAASRPPRLLAATIEMMSARSISRSCTLSSISSRRWRNSARSDGVAGMVSFAQRGLIVLETGPGEIKENVDMGHPRSLPSAPKLRTGDRALRGAVRPPCNRLGLDVDIDLAAPALTTRAGVARPSSARARAVAARLRGRFRPVYDRVSDLRQTQPGSHERHPGLPRADRRPICRRSPSDHQ